MKTFQSSVNAAVGYIHGELLKSYSLFEVICGFAVPDKERRLVFDEIADIFCLGDAQWLQETFKRLSAEDIRRANDRNEYNMLARYAAFNPGSYDAEEHKIIACKGAAVKVRDAIHQSGASSPEDLLRDLMTAAESGIVPCMALLGFMSANGIAVGRDEEYALRMLDGASRWGSLFGTLSGIRCFGATPERLGRLEGILSLTPAKDGEYGEDVASAYGVSLSEADSESRALTYELIRSCCAGHLKRDRRSERVDALLCSRVITQKSKLSMLARPISDGELSALPLGIKDGGERPVMIASTFMTSPLSREEEVARIKDALLPLAHPAAMTYKPLMLVCSDSFVLDLYRDAIAELIGLPRASVSLRDPGNETLGTSLGSNAMLSELDRLGTSRATVFFESPESLDGDSSVRLAKLLRHDYREHFAIGDAELDLSAAVPVLLCRKAPERIISEQCLRVDLSPVTTEEKPDVIKQLLSGFPTLKLSAEAETILCELPVYKARKLLCRADALLCGSSDEISADTINGLLPKEPQRTNLSSIFGGQS